MDSLLLFVLRYRMEETSFLSIPLLLRREKLSPFLTICLSFLIVVQLLIGWEQVFLFSLIGSHMLFQQV